MKKVKLELAVAGVDLYKVVKVTNSVEWTPGETLNKVKLKGIVFRRDITVVVTNTQR